MFRVHFGKLRKNDFKRTINFEASLKELVKFNMQYITDMKCITTHKKLGKSRVFQEKIGISHYVPILPPIKIQALPPYEIYVFGMSKTWATFR